MRKAHLKDGIAATKFMYWLKNIKNPAEIEKMTEMTAVKKIESLRAEREGYLGPQLCNDCGLCR